MIFVVDTGTRTNFAPDLVAMHVQRKAVFVDRAGWKIPVVANQEIDRYDLLEDTMYLIVKEDSCGPVLASARLLTTTGPHLMQDLYPASYRAALPSGPTIWEISRFCTAPGMRDRNRRLGFLWETVCGVMELALTLGIDHVVFAANRALLPLAMTCGWHARMAGPTIPDGSDEMTAVIATITPDGLHNVRARYHVANPIIRRQSGHNPPDRRVAYSNASIYAPLYLTCT